MKKAILIVTVAGLVLSAFAAIAKADAEQAKPAQTATLEQIAKSGDWNSLAKEAAAKTIKWVEAGEKFVIEQAPEVVKEVIRWGIAKHTSGMVGSILICGIVFLIARKLMKWGFKREAEIREIRYNVPDSVMAAYIFGIIFQIVSIIVVIPVFLYNAYQLAFVLCAPRLYLLETLAELAKGR